MKLYVARVVRRRDKSRVGQFAEIAVEKSTFREAVEHSDKFLSRRKCRTLSKPPRDVLDFENRRFKVMSRLQQFL